MPSPPAARPDRVLPWAGAARAQRLSCPQFQVNTSTTGYHFLTGLASDAAGNFVVVSGNFDGSSTGVVARRFDPVGNPLGPEFQVNTYTTGSQDATAVAMRPGGDFVVVWLSDHEAMVQGVFARRFDADGLRLGPEFLVNTYTTNAQEAPAVASDPGGNVVVVWTSEDQDGDRVGVFGQRFDASGARLGAEFPVNGYSTDYEVQPAVAAGPDGSFLAAWTFHTTVAPFEFEVFARRFEASGAAQGADFKVNTYTTGDQSTPLVAATGPGSFVVAWIGDLPGGSGWGVFARADCPMRFHTLTPCRLADTRQPPSLPLAANSFRSFTVIGACGVPADAGAVALNATAVNPTDLGDLRIFPSSQFPPLASALNFAAGRTRANNAIVTTGEGGRVTVQCDMPVGSFGATHLVLDVYGYFTR